MIWHSLLNMLHIVWTFYYYDMTFTLKYVTYCLDFLKHHSWQCHLKIRECIWSWKIWLKVKKLSSKDKPHSQLLRTLSPFLNIIYTHQYFYDKFKCKNHVPNTGFVFRVGLRFYCGDQLTVLVIHWAEFILARTVN